MLMQFEQHLYSSHIILMYYQLSSYNQNCYISALSVILFQSLLLLVSTSVSSPFSADVFLTNKVVHQSSQIVFRPITLFTNSYCTCCNILNWPSVTDLLFHRTHGEVTKLSTAGTKLIIYHCVVEKRKVRYLICHCIVFNSFW